MPTLPPIFYEIFDGLPRQGPGNNRETRKAFSALPPLPAKPKVLDMGCGTGMQSLELARLTGGHLTAVDNYAPYLEKLQADAEAAGLGDHISCLEADILEWEAAPASYDLIWAEGSMYIKGVREALEAWKPWLKSPGYLAFTDMIWFRPDPPAELKAFWQQEYPEMRDLEASLQLVREAGYQLLAHFSLPQDAFWQNYYGPLEKRLPLLRQKYKRDTATLDLIAFVQTEIEIYRKYADGYGYEFFVLEK